MSDERRRRAGDAPGQGRACGTSDDAELVRRLRAGDRDAFGALVRRHGGALLRLARVLVHDGAAAEEVVQESWIAVLDGIQGFEARASFKTWLFRITSNVAKTRALRDARMVPFSSLAAVSEDEPSVAPERFDARGMWADPPERWTAETPEELALRHETKAVLEGAVQRIPPAQRAVLVLRDLEGLETEEICEVLDITVTNQRVLLHRARARVREALEAHERAAR